MRPYFRFAAALLLVLPAAARADIFDFTITSGPTTVTGVMTTTDVEVGGYYTVTDLSGTQNGAAIALLPTGFYGGNNNLFSPTSPYFEFQGIAFSVVGDGDSNIYFDSTDTSTIRLCTDSIPCSDGGTGDLATFSFTPVSTTPEPSSLLLLGTGILSLASMARRRYRNA